MSHSTLSQNSITNPLEASNVSPLHHSGSSTMKVSPRTVLVNWSESNRFKEGRSMDFETFEGIALQAALDNPEGGYDKTNITVTFDNGHTHTCRIDLGCGGNEIGFTDHCVQILDYAESLKVSDPNHWYLNNQDHIDLVTLVTLVTLVKTYQLDRQLVVLGRTMVLEKVKEVQAQKEAEKQAALELRRNELAEHERRQKAFQEGLVIPENAKAVIVATFTEYDEERSEPHSDYYASITTKTVVLAWSTHTRRLFPELRKACLNHPDTEFLNNKELSSEHRENYSMGKGIYLTDLEFIRNGWEVRKVIFFDESQKEKYVPLGDTRLP